MYESMNREMREAIRDAEPKGCNGLDRYFMPD
jgi:hypothetical protein